MKSGILRLAFLFFVTGCFYFSSKAQTYEELTEKYLKYMQDGSVIPAYNAAEQALDKAREQFGEISMEYCIALNNLAFVSDKMGVPEKSLELYTQTLRTLVYNLGISDPIFLTTANSIATIYQKLDNYQKAADMFEVVLILKETEWTETDTGYISTLQQYGAMTSLTGNYSRADSIFLISVPLHRKVYGDNSPQYASSLMAIAVLYDNMGKYSKSEEYYLKVLQIRKKSPGENTGEYAQTLNNLAFLYCNKGNYAKSEATYLEAIRIRKSVLGEEHYLYASSLNNLAGLYQTIGNYAKAEQLIIQAMEIRKRTLGEEDVLYAGSLNNLATLYYSLGDYERAIPLYQQAIEIYKLKKGENSYEYANALNNFAHANKQSGGSIGDSEEMLKMATEIQKSIYGENSLQYASYISNLAMLYAGKHYNFRAMPLLLRCQEIQKGILGEEHPDYATTIDNLGIVQFNMMNYKEAKDLYIQALKIRKKTLGENHSSYRNSLNNVGGVCYYLDEYAQADSMFGQAKQILLNNLDKNFAFLSETEKEKYTATVSGEFKNFQNFYFDYKTLKLSAAADAFDIELATKGMILNAGMRMRQTILNSSDEKALKLYDDWVGSKSALAKQYALPIEKRTVDVAAEEENANNLEKQLTLLSASFKESESLLGSKWQDIQKKLGPNEVAIEFTSFKCNDKRNWIDSVMYVALVLRKDDKTPTMVALCEARQLDSLLQKAGNTDAGFITNLYRGANVVNATKSFSYGKRLYELIWKPLDKLLVAGNKVYFAPSGLLHQIAFAALPYDDKTLLSSRYKLAQLSTTAVLLKESKFKEVLPPTMTIYGGIIYDVIPQAGKREAKPGYISRSLPDDLEKKGTWSYLPGTLVEATTIYDLANAKKIKITRFVGSEALEESYKDLSGKNAPRVLHISSHGFFFPDPTNNEKEYINGSEQKDEVFKFSDNPLNRSGLLFAGANGAWKGEVISGGEDGILTAYEAANVSLDNTQLVVLSACETGLGDIKGSEGVFGLQRAFKMAGAEYLLMSLWKVPDAETAEFMTQFYTNWFAGKPIPDAFIQTQTFMKTKYPKDPYKWAAFVLVK